MSESGRRVRVEGVDWVAFAPVLRLASAFRMALQPGKLVLALVAVLVLFGVGSLMDLAWGDVVEMQGVEDRGVFEAVVDRQTAGFHALMGSALSLDLGLDRLDGQGTGGSVGVIGAVRYLVVETPRWLFTEHPWYAVLYGLIKLVVVGLLGGAICRMAATQACIGQSISARDGLSFAWRRVVWFVGTPLMPGVIVAVLAGVLALAGLVFFNAPVLDVVGAVVFGVLLLLGLLAALVGIGLVLGVPLMSPCLAVEGTDGFDVISRCYNYVFFRPWHYAFYLLSAACFAAVCYVVVVAVASATVGVTDHFVGAGSFAVVDDLPMEDATRYDAIIDQARFSEYAQQTDAEDLGGTLGPAAWIVTQWGRLVTALVAAFMLSLFFCLMTHVYLLMRRAADGTPLDDCDSGEGDVLWATSGNGPADRSEAAGG